MATSQNGWPARRDLPLRPLVVAGESFAPGILDDDDVYTVLRYVAEQLHKRVEPIVRSDWHQADDWGFYYRANVNDPDNLSNHSSATAIDYNATRHPNGVPASQTFSMAQIRTIRQILDEVGGVVRWGGDYVRTPDAMHFEINANKTRVAEVASRLRGDDMPTAEEIAEAVWQYKIPVSGNSAQKELRRAGKSLDAVRNHARKNRAAIAEAAGITPEQLDAVVEELAKIEIEVTVDVKDD